MGVQSILPFKVTVTIDTELNFDGDLERHSDGDAKCKQTLVHKFYLNKTRKFHVSNGKQKCQQHVLLSLLNVEIHEA